MHQNSDPIGVLLKAVAFAADTDTVIEVRNDCIPERTGH